MEVVSTRDEIRELHEGWRHHGEEVAIVPTMGNLHSGHLSLVEFAREHAERVVVTVFVNPTQFGEGEDFEDYPRTLKRDTQRLRKLEADVLFTPGVDTVYPFGIDNATVVSVPGLTRRTRRPTSSLRPTWTRCTRSAWTWRLASPYPV